MESILQVEHLQRRLQMRKEFPSGLRNALVVRQLFDPTSLSIGQFLLLLLHRQWWLLLLSSAFLRRRHRCGGGPSFARCCLPRAVLVRTATVSVWTDVFLLRGRGTRRLPRRNDHIGQIGRRRVWTGDMSPSGEDVVDLEEKINPSFLPSKRFGWRSARMSNR